MLTNQASFKRDGVQDYVTVRATAIIMTVFSLYMAWFFLSTETVTYEIWRGLFSSLGMKVFTFAALVSVMLHIRIGFWQVLTDYVKSTGLRAVVQFFISLVAFVYVAVGLFVLWGL